MQELIPGECIFESGSHPPMIVPDPCDYRGAIGRYVPATPGNARDALARHAQEWSDWGPDERLIQLAGVL